MMKREPVRPRIDGEAAQAPQLADALAIDDLKRETELAFELVLPLRRSLPAAQR